MLYNPGSVHTFRSPINFMPKNLEKVHELLDEHCEYGTGCFVLCSLSRWRGSFLNGDYQEIGLSSLQGSIRRIGTYFSMEFGCVWLAVG